jgi:hypothetical protein
MLEAAHNSVSVFAHSYHTLLDDRPFALQLVRRATKEPTDALKNFSRRVKDNLQVALV